MKISFIGDVHLGYQRKSFTSVRGRELYKQAIVQNIMKAIGVPAGYKVQCGDLFDKYTNSDETLREGIDASIGMGMVLVGNHDVSNTLDHLSTMSMCRSIVNQIRYNVTTFMFPSGIPKSDLLTVQEDLSGKCVHLHVVPYCYNQDLFEKTLRDAYDKSIKGEPNILVLHTNYALGYETTDTTNNLTQDMAESLLEKFDYIISGHEHNYSTHLKGRLIMTGSVFPLSTAELENKYVHIFDTETGKFEKELIWEAGKSSSSYDIKELPETLPQGTQFATITGKASPEEIAEGFKTVSKWWKECETLLICKPTYEVVTKHRESVSVVKEDMVSHIRSMLKGDAVPLFDNLVKEVEGGQ